MRDDRFPPPPEATATTAPPTIKPPALRWHRDADPNADRAWLVKDLVPETGKGLLSGQWGSGKTFGVLDLCASTMTGQPFAGRRMIRRGGILFIAPEGAFEIPIRLRGLVNGKIAGDALAETAGGNPTVDPDDLPFAWIEECPRLVEAEAVEILAKVAEQAADELRTRYDMPLALIVVDTVAAGAGFDDENSAAEAQRVMNALERLSHRTGAFVFGVDHFGKSTETGTRGSSAKEAAADVVLAMLASRDEAGNVSNTRMAVRKLRGGRIGQETPYILQPIEIGTDRWGESITTCIVDWQTDRTSAAAVEAVRRKWPTSLRVFQAALQFALIEHGKDNRPFGNDGPELKTVMSSHVRAEFVSSYAADGETEAKRTEAKKKAFQRAVKAAQGKGLIAVREIAGNEHFWMVADV
ncbi:AAA family ATPase [Methylorubrum thiocyanatum]|uniref:ATP-binding protein n=1 Tax=Methylorubrum thiocyanatum TaxID=47958 RepID=UPI00383BB325